MRVIAKKTLKDFLSIDTKELITKIISLPVDDRAMIADTILKSLNSPESAIDKKWIVTTKRRAIELSSGKVKAIPGDEVFNKIWARLST